MMKRRHQSATDSNEVALRGFTLLEVLITAMLSATLMLGLWTLFGTYLRLFKVGEVKTEQSQIVRALTQQFSKDLLGVIQSAQPNKTAPGSSHQLAVFSQPASESSASSSSSSTSLLNSKSLMKESISQTSGSSLSSSTLPPLPRFGLKGTETSLRLDGLQATLEMPSSTDSEEFFDENKQSLGPRASELRTIIYSFRERSEQSFSERVPATGLIRQEFEWEAGSPSTLDSDVSRRHTRRRSIRSNVSNENGFPELTEEELREVEEMDEWLLWVPEVGGVEFRYFDGREWLSQWDSHQKKIVASRR